MKRSDAEPNRRVEIHQPGTVLFDVGLLSKRFGRIAALTEVSFTVRAGEVLGLIGPNGAGKTTLFECLAGVLPVDAGGIRVNGGPITSRERAALVFYLPDAIAPWSAQPVRWALDFIIGLFGGDPSLRGDVVEQLDLRPLLDRPIGQLSKGQRKRALLALGLLTPHPVLLADEPFDGLDLRQTRDIASTLRAHANRGRTLFLSIHQIADAARVCDRFVLLSSGKVCGEGTQDELATLASLHASSPSRDLEEVFLALT
jgi:ABC-type multidrug transport system ATPase subunit